MVNMLVFSSAIYYAEMKRDTVDSILTGQWWAIITMTTVGYGDMHPKSTIGYVIGVICAIVGVLLVASILPVLGNRYTEYYQRYEETVRINSRKRRRNPPNTSTANTSVNATDTSNVQNKEPEKDK